MTVIYPSILDARTSLPVLHDPLISHGPGIKVIVEFRHAHTEPAGFEDYLAEVKIGPFLAAVFNRVTEARGSHTE